MSAVKSIYVRSLRALRPAVEAPGILRWLETRRGSRLSLWSRSLFAIYDIDDMVALDLPWWTFAATAKVDTFLAGRADARVLEYGSGASTVWLARRAAEVHSIEHDERWAAIVRRHLRDLPNARLRVVSPMQEASGPDAVRSRKPGHEGLDFSEYVNAVSNVGGAFDLIVIDGRCRIACLRAAAPYLKSDGLVVFDNSRRRRYRQGLGACGWPRLDTVGLTACLPYPDATSLLSADAGVLADLREARP